MQGTDWFLSKRYTPERGASRFAFLLLLALTSAIVYVVAIFVPVYQGQQQMHTAAAEIVERGAKQNLTDADVRAQLHEKVRENGLPEDHTIELARDGRKLTASIKYTQFLRFPFYTYKWPVEIRVQDLGY
ncbi:MAG: hypothetical protein JNJ50_32200 [Acidobacteria bacterium]|nr:hypothetical protein [Acidobacteriota bacterium]